MNRYTLVGLAAGLIVGIFIGYQAGSSTPSRGDAAVSGPPPGMPPGGGQGAPGDNFQARITQLQQIVARDPKNVEAWVQLGNDYFDTRQPQKAIDAYARALELRPDDPNVLTDQGVMYRDLGRFDQAIANFEKASRLDPKHVQSLYNMGVVYLNDLKEKKKAVQAWNRIIEVAPESDQARQARIGIEEAQRAGQ